MTTENVEEKKSKDRKQRKELTWRTQDWVWLLAVIIYAQGLVFIHNELLMQAISYVSTFVSIALAGIAIYISIKEATNNDHLKTEIHVILNEMKTKIGDLDTKMDRFNPIEFQKINENEVAGMKNALLEDIKQVYGTQQQDLNMDELINKVNKNTEILIKNLNEVQNEYINENIGGSISFSNPYKDCLQTYEIGEQFSMPDFSKRMTKSTQKLYTADLIHRKLEGFRELGMLEKSGHLFKRIS